MKHAIAAALVALVVSGSAWGDTGNELYSQCQDGEKTNGAAPPAWGYCLGYISGTFMATRGANKGVGRVTFCAPSKVTKGQVRDIVVKWLEDNPAQRHYMAPSLIASALSEAYPCKKP